MLGIYGKHYTDDEKRLIMKWKIEEFEAQIQSPRGQEIIDAYKKLCGENLRETLDRLRKKLD